MSAEAPSVTKSSLLPQWIYDDAERRRRYDELIRMLDDWAQEEESEADAAAWDEVMAALEAPVLTFRSVDVE